MMVQDKPDIRWQIQSVNDGIFVQASSWVNPDYMFHALFIDTDRSSDDLTRCLFFAMDRLESYMQERHSILQGDSQ